MGLNSDALSGGTVTEDFNNDGHLDIMASSWQLTDQVQLFQNNGDGTFSEMTHEAGLTGITGGLNMVHADYNNDGFVDVFGSLEGVEGIGGIGASVFRNLGNDHGWCLNRASEKVDKG